jgi:hypothetical protein
VTCAVHAVVMVQCVKCALAAQMREGLMVIVFLTKHYIKLIAGYNSVITIPSGATNIDIRQHGYNSRKDDDNYLALENSNRNWILNGDWQVSVFGQTLSVRGAALEYSGSDHIIETITSGTVPVKEDLYLHVINKKRNSIMIDTKIGSLRWRDLSS